MTTTFVLKTLGVIIALAAGLYLGWGRYDQSPHEIERALGGRGKRKKVRRHFMFLDMMRKTQKRGSELRRTRRHFKTAASTRPAGVDVRSTENEVDTDQGQPDHRTQ